MDIVVDIQGFRDAEKKFIPKEVGLVAIDTLFVRHWILRPPYPLYRLSNAARRENYWLTRNHHGIDWFDGEDDPEYFKIELRESTRHANNIYVRGSEKAHYLRNLLARNIYNLENISPAFKFLSDDEVQGRYCDEHSFRKSSGFHCAYHNAYKLKQWILERYTSENKDSINVILPNRCSSDENWETAKDDNESDCRSGNFDENVNENTDVRKAATEKENKTKLASTVPEEEEEELSKLESRANSSGKNNTVATATKATQTDHDNSTANFAANVDTLTLPAYTRVRSSTEKDELSRNFERIAATPCRTCGSLSCRSSTEGVDEVDGYRR